MSQRNTWRIVFTLAWRYLWRNHRRTLIMVAAISMGVWAMIIMNAFSRGMVDAMLNTSMHGYLGHIQIHHPEYRDDPSVVNSMAPMPDALLQYLNDNNLRYANRVRVPSVVSSERDTTAVFLMGIEPDNEARLSDVAGQIIAGRFLESKNDDGIVIGAKMADRLSTELGKRIVVMSQDPDNNIADRGFRVVGIYKAKLASMEEQFVFTGIDTAQKLLNLGEKVSEFEIQSDNYVDTDLYLPTVIKLAEQWEVKPWYELDTYLSTMLSVMDGYVLVFIIVVFLALSFGLVNTLVMAVFERVREIGLILALGMRPSVVLRQILVETFFLLVVGLIIGNIFVLLTVMALPNGLDLSAFAEGFEMMGVSATMYLSVLLKDWLLANGLVIVLGVLSAVLPAVRASRYDPVRALNKH